MSSEVSADKALEEAIKLAELGQTTKLVEWARGYLHITRNCGGRPVRSGPLVWVEDQLKKLKAKVSQDEKPRISNVWLFPNKMVVVLDQFGHQMPEYQGQVEDVREKINAVFSGEWR